MHTDITQLIQPHTFVLTPDFDDTIADQPRKTENIVASAKKKAQNLISQMRERATTDRQLMGRLPLDRTRSDELDTFVDAFKAELETELSGFIVLVVPHENVQPRVPERDLTVYAWPRLVVAAAAS